MLLLVYKPNTRGRAAPEGGGLINRNNTIKGIKCLLPVARLRDAFATRARQEMRLSLALPARAVVLRLWAAEKQLESLVTPTVVAYVCAKKNGRRPISTVKMKAQRSCHHNRWCGPVQPVAAVR